MTPLLTIKVTDDYGWKIGKLEANTILHAVYTYSGGKFDQGHRITLYGGDSVTATAAIVRPENSDTIVARFKVVEL